METKFSPLGILSCLDGFMNIALEQTEEYQNGQLKNKYGDAFIRGNNGKTFILKSISSFQFFTSAHKSDERKTLPNVSAHYDL